MILYSWNVNGIRAAIKKGFWDWFGDAAPDVVGVQETKAEREQLPEKDRENEGYESWWNSCKIKKGYSGTACWSRVQPIRVEYGLPDEKYQGEGRVIMMEFEKFHFFNIYFPNGQQSDERLQYKMGFYDAFLEYAQELRKTKPIIAAGDYNTAHKPIDLVRPKPNEGTSGFLPIERAWLDTFIDHGYNDGFRMFDQGPDQYTWWTYRFGARGRNAGWRIDYFFVSDEIKDKVKRVWHETEVMGSDHCPIGIEVDL